MDIFVDSEVPAGEAEVERTADVVPVVVVDIAVADLAVVVVETVVGNKPEYWWSRYCSRITVWGCVA